MTPAQHIQTRDAVERHIDRIFQHYDPLAATGSPRTKASYSTLQAITRVAGGGVRYQPSPKKSLDEGTVTDMIVGSEPGVIVVRRRSWDWKAQPDWIVTVPEAERAIKMLRSRIRAEFRADLVKQVPIEIYTPGLTPRDQPLTGKTAWALLEGLMPEHKELFGWACQHLDGAASYDDTLPNRVTLDNGRQVYLLAAGCAGAWYVALQPTLGLLAEHARAHRAFEPQSYCRY